MTITLNGNPHVLEEEHPQTLANLIKQLGFKPDRIAVELNGTIPPKLHWPAQELAEGDRVEIVQFVGGGAPVRDKSSFSHRAP